MEATLVNIPVSETIDEVSGLLILPPDAHSLLVLAHGAGAGMQHSFMEALASGLAAIGIATLRYNFPFKENGKGRPDPPPVAEKVVSAAIKKAGELAPHLPVFAAGKSFGGRMSSQYLSKSGPEFIKGIIFYGFPLHPAGNPSVSRAEHLYQVSVPMLFLQGTKDALADLTLLKPICDKLPMASLVTFEGADHAFKAGKRNVIQELVDATGDWIVKNNRAG